jgi:predicted RNA-binding Zn ribbon-like protein
VRTAETSEFRFGLGHPVLEFVATLARRRDDPQERLQIPADLDEWLALSGLAADAHCDERLLVDARELREAIYRLLDAARGHTRLPSSSIELVNRWSRDPTSAPQIDAARRVTRVGPNPARAALTQLAIAAIELAAGPELDRITNCADPTCSLMFIDHSRPGRRRWCSMDRCGNRAKTAGYRRRRRR